MKRTPLKKQGKQKISKIQKLLWEECKRIIRDKYKNKDGSWNCYTCDRRLDEAYKAQTGHFIPKASVGAYLKYDLRILRIQCYFCNINCGGAGAEFYKRMVKDNGQDYVDEIYRDKQKTVNAYDHYTSLLEKYKNI